MASSESAEGRLSIKTPMRSVMIVVAQPGPQRPGAFPGVRVGPGVGPLSQQRLDEALGLAVGARSIRTGAQVAATQAATGEAEELRQIGRAVVGHHLLDADAEATIEGHGALEEPHGHRGLFVGQYLDVGEPGGVVDADMRALPPDSTHALTVVAVDAVTNTATDPAQLLHVEVQQLAGMASL